jgi:hypothetical protein
VKEENKDKKEEEKKELGGKLGIIRRQEEEAKFKLMQMKLKEEKYEYVNDMFGLDFEVEKLTEGQIEIDKLGVNEFKDEAMKALQEKSFKGLYLRLQFWINQIFKRLQGKTEGCNFKLYKTHILVMKTIIMFLNSMRDVVFELRIKGIDDYDDYEWQKQIRLTWNATESGCKVEWGGWSTYQGNEYLGSRIRLPLTPLTSRYFVFASAALREKSAVLFKSIPACTKARDIFEEYASICTVSLQSIDLEENVSVKR